MEPQTKPAHAYPDRDLPMREGHYACGGCGEKDDVHPSVQAFANKPAGRWPCDGYDWTRA
jgi:hypothetical protein